jgi:hypothetical protein
MRPTLCLSAGLLATCAFVLPAHALAPPTDKVAEKNTTRGAAFDLAIFEGLSPRTFTIRTPWDKQPVTFAGPLLRDVLAAAKASGSSIKALAPNDYQTLILSADAQKFDVIVAHQINGAAVPVRTKGQLLIVYSFDTKAELQSTVYYEQSARQPKSMTIE